MMKENDIEKIMALLPGESKDSPEIAANSTETDPRWKELNGIARMMREEPPLEPPGGLADRVMARVRAHRPSPWKVLGDALLKPREASFDPLRAMRSPVSGQECSFYFIMVGVFHAILGIFLMIGLHKLGTALAVPGWVRWQPQISLATAACMAAMGIYLLKDGKFALRTARIGTLVYLGFALLNGVIVPLEWNIPVSAALSLLSTLVGVPTGIFLIRTILNYGKQYA